MAELLTQHKIASTNPVRFLSTIEVLKSDFLTQTQVMYFEQLIPMFIEEVYIQVTGIRICYLLCKWMPLALHNVFGTYHIGQA